MKIKEDNKQLRSVVSKLEEKIDDTDAYERRDCLVISGDQVPAAETGENTVEVVNRLIKDKLKMIFVAHRCVHGPQTGQETCFTNPRSSEDHNETLSSGSEKIYSLRHRDFYFI